MRVVTTVCAIVGILGVYSANFCENEEYQNDDFCDCDNGFDEWQTSACAGKTPKRFYCAGSGLLKVSIPTSRVGDGICDCCDGEDEVGSLFEVQCNDVCGEDLHDLKVTTLAEYRKVYSGIRARDEIVQTMNRKKMREQQTQDGLENEYEETKKLYYRLKLWLQVEQKLENSLRFAELRARVRECAEGVLEKCDLFNDGLQVTPVDIPDLWTDEGSFGARSVEVGSPGDGAAVTRNGNDIAAQSSGDRSKEGDEEAKQQQSEASQERYRRQMSAVDRVRVSYCSFAELEQKGLLTNEDSMRVHKSVHQYLEFVLGRGGQAERKRQRGTEYMRRRKSLFGPYLDNGQAGLLLGAQVLCELVGFLVSPVTVPLTLLHRAHRVAYDFVWSELKRCARRGVLDEDSCSESLVDISAYILDTVHPTAPLMQLLEYADITQYGPFVAVMRRIMPYVRQVEWAGRIVQMAPWYYYRFYIGNGADRLPALRDACTLREGLRVAGVEMESTREKVTAHEKMLEAKKAGQGGDGQGRGAKKQHHSMVRREHVRYGDDGAWEAVDGMCLEKQDGEYLYRVCLFEEVFQGSTRIGCFQHWGGTAASEGAKTGQGKGSTLAGVVNRIKNRLPRGNQLPRDVQDGEDEGEGLSDETVVDFNPAVPKQYYGHGARCFNGRDRHAILSFACATVTEIAEVTEYEVCGYAITINTPLACDRQREQMLLQRLTDLNVFGFSSNNKTSARAEQEVLAAGSGQ